jgi:hypothetical protein
VRWFESWIQFQFFESRDGKGATDGIGACT